MRRTYYKDAEYLSIILQAFIGQKCLVWCPKDKREYVRHQLNCLADAVNLKIKTELVPDGVKITQATKD